MTDPFRNYDSWLERPYQQAEEEGERYQNWCDAHDLDPETEDAQDAYNDYIDSQWEVPIFDEDSYDEEDYDDYSGLDLV